MQCPAGARCQGRPDRPTGALGPLLTPILMLSRPSGFSLSQSLRTALSHRSLLRPAAACHPPRTTFRVLATMGSGGDSNSVEWPVARVRSAFIDFFRSKGKCNWGGGRRWCGCQCDQAARLARWRPAAARRQQWRQQVHWGQRAHLLDAAATGRAGSVTSCTLLLLQSTPMCPPPWSCP